jgi:hypothetical protein
MIGMTGLVWKASHEWNAKIDVLSILVNHSVEAWHSFDKAASNTGCEQSMNENGRVTETNKPSKETKAMLLVELHPL